MDSNLAKTLRAIDKRSRQPIQGIELTPELASTILEAMRSLTSPDVARELLSSGGKPAVDGEAEVVARFFNEALVTKGRQLFEYAEIAALARALEQRVPGQKAVLHRINFGLDAEGEVQLTADDGRFSLNINAIEALAAKASGLGSTQPIV